MKLVRYFIMSVITLLVIIGTTGCQQAEENPTGTPQDPTGAQARVNEANTQLGIVLNNLINGPEPEHLGDINFTVPHSLYLQALQLDSTNRAAHFGAGILEVVMLSQDPETQSIFDRFRNFIERDSVFEAGGSSVFRRAPSSLPALQWQAVGIPALSAFSMLRKMADYDEIATADPTIGELQSLIINEVLPRIATAKSHLQRVTTDTNFVFIVTPTMQGDPQEDALEIDLTEIYATLTGLNAMSAMFQQFCAYNFNIPSYTGAQMLALLTPGSAFGALNTNGASLMSQARASWLSALNNLDDAIYFLEHEADWQGNDVIKIDPHDGITRADLDSVKHYLPMVRNAVQSSETFHGDFDGDSLTADVDLEISLNALFTNPVPDIKTLFPSYTVVLDTMEYTRELKDDTTLTAQVHFNQSGFYYWDYWAELRNGVIIHQQMNSNFPVPSWDSAWANKVQQMQTAVEVYLDLHMSDHNFTAGDHTLQSDFEVDNHIPSQRYSPVITWTAQTFNEWILPNPSINGALPGMTDAHFKDVFGIIAADWQRTTHWHLW